MNQEQKRKDLLKLSDRDLVNRILAFPDRQALNRDEEGNRRRYPSAEMAVRAKKQMEKNPDYRISNKMRWCMADSFSQFSFDRLKVAGITFAKADASTLDLAPVKQEGTKTTYSLLYSLKPEPENSYDKNAVAVYAKTKEGEDAKIGYLPASYVAVHPILTSMTAQGTLTDHSNGHFKTISYVVDMDTEAIEEKLSSVRNRGAYTYRMPFLLNGPVSEDADSYLTDHYYGENGWASRLNDELEYWGVNGEVDAVAFRFPSERTGEILVETKTPLCEEAMEVCGSFFHYSLETGISSDLRRDGYVKTPQNLPAVNTRDRTYFSLAAEPEDFAKAVESLSLEQSGPSL